MEHPNPANDKDKNNDILFQTITKCFATTLLGRMDGWLGAYGGVTV